MTSTRSGFYCWAVLIAAFQPVLSISAVNEAHNAAFWKTIKEHNFAMPSHGSAGALALEIADLAGSTDPSLRDSCGYEILANWIYQNNLLTGEQLEALRRKLVPGMIFQIGEAENDTIFRRSFSALYMSILAARDLQKPFLSDSAFKATLETALQCYANEKDLRGYVPVKGWAHATAHVADLLKFLGRNPKLSGEDQKKIIAAIAQRCGTVPSVFVWGEDGRMAAALLSIVDRKDFDQSSFNEWFKALIAENNHLWKEPKIDIPEYVRVRTQSNVLVQLVAKIAAQKENDAARRFGEALNEVLSRVDHP
jgi:hypothetical protein